MSRLLRVLILTTVSIGLFAAIGAILPGIDAFEPIGKSLNDIAVTDIFYSATRNGSPVENDKFLIIDTSDSDRGEIARAIEHASSADAAVIGVDIVFSDPGTDSLATAALCEAMDRSRDKIVAAVHLNSWDEATHSYISTVSTAIDSLGLQQAYTNFITHSDNSYIRNYSVAVPGLTPSFAQCVADRYRSIYEDDTVIEPTSEGIVDFTPQHFDVVDAADFAAIDTMAFGRMVLLGSVDGDEDYHYTPIGSMSGVVIQAYSTDTILNSATTVLPQCVVWCVCVLLVVLASYGFIVLRDNFESRNTVANRYTYAFLGLGNIIYPTVTILLTIFFIGLLYLTTLIYLPPLVIAGSLAFIPVAYDLMGIAKAVCFRRATKAAAVSVCVLLFSANADAQRTHQDYLNDIEYLNLNCPFEKGKLKENIHPDVAWKLSNLVIINHELPSSNAIEESVFECMNVCGIMGADIVLSDYYLDEVDSPYLKKGVNLLASGLQNNNEPMAFYYGKNWYKLALCYYFGLGTDVDYDKSRECLDKAFDISQKMTEDERKDQGFYSKDGTLNILGSCLRSKGFPNKVCDDRHGSMALYQRDNKTADNLIADCEDALLAEDPENLLSGFPDCKIPVTPLNFIRFYPAIMKDVRFGKPRQLLTQCESTDKTWQDCLTLGLIYYHYYDKFDRHLIFNNKLTEQTFTTYAFDNNDEFVSARFFDKADKLFKKTSSKLSDDDKKYIGDFITAYRNLSSGKIKNTAIAGLEARQNLEAAALSKVLIKMPDFSFLTNFNLQHNLMIDYAASEGDLIAKYLLGYMYKIGVGVFYRHTKKARNILSKWAGKEGGNFNDSVDRFKYVVDNCIRRGGIANLDRLAGYEYSTLTQPIPKGKFSEEFEFYALAKEFDRFLAEEGREPKIKNDKAEFAGVTQSSSNVSKPTKPAKVRGTVSDVNGEPLIGASIKVDGTNIVATSDMDGCFNIAVKKGDRIDLSYIGYEPASFVYDGQKINVVLKEAKDNKKWSASDETMTSTSKKQTTQPPKNQPQPQPQPAPAAKPKVNFAFRTPNNTKFSEPEFDLTFVTNSRTATYRITGSEPQDIPASALSSGKLRITLPKRDCELTLVDESNKMHVLSFIYDEALSLRKSATLHILSIGVNNYPAQNLENLRFAEADAEAVVDAFVKRHRYTFSNINKTVLLGNKVTRRSIETEIEKISENAKPNDLAVIFFAGHGLVDSKKYFLATSEVDDAQRPNRGGLSATLFKEKIDYIPCKLVVFIDACHSAKVFDAFRSNDFFKELQSSRNGTDIYTSSGSDERSREDSKFGHGYFTQALIEACDFKNSDKDGDGRITVKEIRNYLEWRIPELTANQQNPDYRNIESSDYSIFIKQ